MVCRANKVNRKPWFLHVLYFHVLNRSRINIFKNAKISSSNRNVAEWNSIWVQALLSPRHLGL
jgi:hypothetical protein